MRKIIWAGQFSCLFAIVVLSLRHIYIMPAQNFPMVLAVLLIGFIPSVLFFYSPYKKLIPYVVVSNALFVVSVGYYFMEETALSGVFLLVPVFSLLFKNKKLYIFSAISSMIIFYFLIKKETPTTSQIVFVIDHMSIFLIMVFLIFLIVNELISNTKIETKQLQTIISLSRSVEARDSYTKGHSERVALLGKAIVEFIPGIDKEVVYQTGVIHDVGKLTTPDYILLKKGRLTDQEYALMKKHPAEGAYICRSLSIPEEFIKGVLYHHERWDGLGYPKGLKGEEIPLVARILGIADAIDAMSSTRAYRNAMDFEKVRSEVEKGNGTQFDPFIASTVLENWDYLINTVHKANLKRDIDKEKVEEVITFTL